MAADINADEDFAQVVDELESVELRRRGSSAKVAITAARKQSAISSEATVSAGFAQQADSVWLPELAMSSLRRTGVGRS